MGICACGPHQGILSQVGGLLPWMLLAVWSAGAFATAWLSQRRWLQFRRLLAHARPAPAPWQSLAVRIASELSVRRPLEILAVPGLLPPMVVAGWRRSRLLLPAELLERLNATQRRALLLHELTHLKRGDHLVRLLEGVVGIAFWWLPIVRSIGGRLRACEEACCDAAVVARLPRARRDYARLLLDVIDFADPLPRHALPHATAMSPSDGLEQRVRAILQQHEPKRRARSTAVLAIGAACAIFPCGLRYDIAQPPAITSTALAEGCEPAAVEVIAFRCPDFKPAALCCAR
jgi:beta-lactamase regulating signal transducer with metallopeptidase domain